MYYFSGAGVVLHTHGDQPIMLAPEALTGIIKKLDPSDERDFASDWLVRYAVVVKCRGVIQNKGYIVSFKGIGVETPHVDAPPAKKMVIQQEGLQGGCMVWMVDNFPNILAFFHIF